MKKNNVRGGTGRKITRRRIFGGGTLFYEKRPGKFPGKVQQEKTNCFAL